MTREEYIDEFIDYICTEIKDSKAIAKLLNTSEFNYLEPEKVLDIVEYRLNWLFDNYTFTKKETNAN